MLLLGWLEFQVIMLIKEGLIQLSRLLYLILVRVNIFSLVMIPKLSITDCSNAQIMSRLGISPVH